MRVWREVFWAAAASFAAVACGQGADAQDAEKGAGAPYDSEVAYAERLVEYGFPDFADVVIARTKAKWPESETVFFAIEVRGMLSLGKEEEAKKLIAALPDRKSAKYWAARLALANFCWRRGRKADCGKIYKEFFDANKQPSAELASFTRDAYWQYGQILAAGGKLAEAADSYSSLLKLLDKNKNDEEASAWCNVSCETAEIYLRLASAAEPGKPREEPLAKARKIVDQLLWMSDQPVFFGRAIAMRAQMELLKGDVAKAQSTIDEYIDQLAQLHKQIEEADPDGRHGLLRQSPMPLCRFMLAEMMWKEAEAEMKKGAKRDDELVRSLLFGAKGPKGKRGEGGAYRHAINVFVRYPQSAWAGRAGDLAKTIAEFTEKTYGKKIKTVITPEQEKSVRASQFRVPSEIFGEGKYEEAIKGFHAALSSYPEGPDSVSAVEHIAISYLNLIAREKQANGGGDAAKIKEWRIDADAVEGYVAERFSGSADRMTATEGGNATLRLAALEKQFGEAKRSAALYRSFLECYPDHANAPAVASSLASEARKESRLREAVTLYSLVAERYTNSLYFTSALVNKAVCLERLGDRAGAIEAMGAYVAAEKDVLRSVKAQMSLADMYQKEGRELLETAATNGTPEAVQAQLDKGTAQTVRGIKQFQSFAKRAGDMMADKNTSAGDRKEYSGLREKALYLAADNWGRLTRPEKNLPVYRERSVAGFEQYVKEYPKGELAKNAYIKLSMMYTLMNDLAKSKGALERLRKEFPDSDEAKKSMPRLARSLVEYSKSLEDGDRKTMIVQEIAAIYTEMIRKGGTAYSAADYALAGENLVEARNWDLADEAFDKAIATAATNQTATAARARIGKARSLYAQKHFGEAREMLDAFMSDPKASRSPVATNACELIVEIALRQGAEERDSNLRMKHYGAALAAAKKLRGYWAKEPVWKQDRATFLMPADVKIAQADAETAMGLDEEARRTRSLAAANLQSYLQTRVPEGDEGENARFSPEERANIEEAYSKFIPLLAKLGPEQASKALEAGARYLQLFPDGEYKAAVQRAMNEASASAGKAAAAPAEKQDGGNL